MRAIGRKRPPTTKSRHTTIVGARLRANQPRKRPANSQGTSMLTAPNSIAMITVDAERKKPVVAGAADGRSESELR